MKLALPLCVILLRISDSAQFSSPQLSCWPQNYRTETTKPAREGATFLALTLFYTVFDKKNFLLTKVATKSCLPYIFATGSPLSLRFIYPCACVLYSLCTQRWEQNGIRQSCGHQPPAQGPRLGHYSIYFLLCSLFIISSLLPGWAGLGCGALRFIIGNKFFQLLN